jgi:hypothetical protein
MGQNKVVKVNNLSRGDIMTKGVLIFLSLFFMACYSVLSVHAQVGENQIINGDFENPLDPEKGQRWEFCCNLAQGKMDIDKKEFVKGKQSMLVTVNAIGAVAWEPHVKIIGLKVEKGKKYTYSAFMKAEKQRSIVIDTRRAAAEIFFGNSGVIQISTEWKEYSLTVTATDTNDGDVMVLTQLGVNRANTWIDNARFYEGEYIPDPNLNVVPKAISPLSKVALTWASIKKTW